MNNVNLRKNSKDQFSENRYLINVEFYNELCDKFLDKQIDVKEILECIKRYVESENRFNRILYYQISSKMLGLNDESMSTATDNSVKLIEYISSNKDFSEDVCNIAFKICDHIYLVSSQNVAIEKRAMSVVEEVKKKTDEMVAELMNDIKGELNVAKRDYITILGIFAAIVLSFTGGIAFSSSVLENINGVHILKLLLVIILLAMLIINIIHMLVYFILKLNDKDTKKYFCFICVIDVLFILAILGLLCIFCKYGIS